MANKEENEKKALEFNILDSRLQELEQSFQLLEKQMSELQLCSASLDELKNTKIGTEAFSTISPGVFTKTKLADNKEVIINIGSKILCKKSIDEAKEIIQKKIEQVKDIKIKIDDEINIIIQQIRQLETSF